MGLHKKKDLDTNVYEEALRRIRYLYSLYDEVVVSFSGGKDSTALLLCTLEVARELDRLPVRAVFYDEEAIHPPTVEYVERVREREDVDLEWYCLPVQHRNACSNEQPFWHCWHPEERHLWVREPPDCAIMDHPRFEFGMSMQEWGTEHFRYTNAVCLQGIRTEESIRRYRVIARKKEEIYISRPSKGVVFAYPIYDWRSKDVWKLIEQTGADYNRTYDHFNRTRLHNHLLHQRVCPPFGEEPLRGLDLYAECWPDLWHRMINRVPGAATAARYGNTELYSQGFKPEGVTWRQHIENLLESYPRKYRFMVQKRLNAAMQHHKDLTADPIPSTRAHPLSGVSWKLLVKIVTRGDFKGRVIQHMTDEARKAQQRLGITQAQAEAEYGR